MIYTSPWPTRAALAGALLALCLAWQCGPHTAQAEPMRRELALAVAKLCVNEAGFSSPADCALIYQVAETHARTMPGRLGFLRAHSRRVLGTRHCAEHRPCQWTRELQWSDARPPSWPFLTAWERYVPRWRRVRRQVWRLVTGQETQRPCQGHPVTWGGAMDWDSGYHRGLVPLKCEGTINVGWGRE